MSMERRIAGCVTILWMLGALPLLHAAEPKFEVQLKKAFVDKYKDRTLIKATMVVRHSHKQPNPVGQGSEDGDLHFSGESDDVGLPFVAEVVNAAAQTSAVAIIKQTAKHNEDQPKDPTPMQVVGAWRLWFEHPSKSQVQMGNNPFFPDTTNPNHSFEIHPTSAVNQLDLRASFVPVRDLTTHPPRDYKGYGAEVAFPYFDGLGVVIKGSNSAVAIRSQQLKYNYVDFYIELTQNPKKVQDGYIALAEVQDKQGEAQSDQPRRMIFVEGTPAAQSIGQASTGDRFHVLGIPRLNLNAVSYLVSQHGTQQFSAKLPYEMIIVGIYPK